ncbi:MAG: NAD(P)-binding domain-containing protein [Gammaproteobacteria bacterium]|nr:NAD(P)-binding domain-containing protein [Gammaproteobacteria bacterium]
MDSELQENILYALLIVMSFIVYIWQYRRKQRRNIAQIARNQKAGLTEPASLHPKIDSNQCIGAGACVSACPEGDVIGMIRGKATLINPTKCIGHGACKAACPVGAITLVFGTENRSIEIPETDEYFETNVPGIYIAGELGGMGLIRNALEQGKQAIDAISKNARSGEGCLDVVIIGAGPAGISASLGAMEKKLKYVTLEQDSLGGTVAHFPRGKIVMTAPVNIPVVGKVKFKETTKEALIDFWTKVEKDTGVKINYHERMEDIQNAGDYFQVTSSKSTYKTKSILLAMGRRGTPRKLGVKGENKTKVVYRLIDPAQYIGQHVLVVGGGDSALEAAITIAEEEGATVTISYRSAAFSRAKEKNRQKTEQAEREGKLTVFLSSNIKEVADSTVSIINKDKDEIVISNDVVIVCAGGIPPTPFLKKSGIHVEEKYGTE